MENTSESKFASAKKIAVVILLGAVGSGVWTWVGEPLLNVIGNVAIRVVGWFSSAYVESMYAEIGKGQYERSATFVHGTIAGLYVIIWSIIPFLTYEQRNNLTKIITPFRATLKAAEDGHPIQIPVEKKNPKQVLADAERLARSLTVSFWVLAAVAPFAITFQVAAFYRSSYASEATVFVERSIDILSPHINSDSILRLRANYRAISSRKQFVALHQELGDLAKAKNVEIPAFSLF